MDYFLNSVPYFEKMTTTANSNLQSGVWVRIKEVKKIFVTGAAGFIGSHLIDKLIDLGYNVIGIDNLSFGNIKNVNSKCQFIEMDLGLNYLDNRLEKALEGADYVFHCASIAKTQYSVENPRENHVSNIDGTFNLLEAIRKNGKIKKVIHSSSCGIYGDGHEGLIDENDEKRCGTPYSVSKYLQELYLETYYKLYGIKSVMLRYANVYGTSRQNQSGVYPNVLAALATQKEKDNKIKITGDGTQMRDFVHVYDVVEANIKAMQSDFYRAEVFNIGTGIGITMNDISKYYNCLVEYIDMRPGEAHKLVLNNEKAFGMLRWTPMMGVHEGITNYLKQIWK